MDITAETILKNYPQVWWQIYRQARAETLSDPNCQKEMAQRHLQATLARPGATPPPASPARPSPQASATTISAEQKKINRIMGLSDETVEKFNHETPSQLEPTQAQVNKALGLSDQDYLKGTNGR